MNPVTMNLIASVPQQGISQRVHNPKKQSEFNQTMKGIRQEDKVNAPDKIDVKQKEEAKETPQLGKKTPVKNASELETTQIEEGEETSVEEQMMPILLALMDLLNITEEQLNNTLTKLDLEPQDLLTEENFRVVISDLLGEETPVLTLNQDTIKAIGKIWESIKGLEKFQVNNEGEKNTVLQQIVPENSDDESQGLSLQSRSTIEIKQSVLANETTNVEEVKVDQATSEKNIVTPPKVEDLLGLRIPIQTFQAVEQVKVGDRTAQFQQMGRMDTSKMVIDQVIQKIEINQLIRHNEIQMELSPKELGKVVMKLVEQNGVITAQIKVESEKTKEILMQNIHGLKEGLENQGLTIGNFQVDVQENESKSQMYQQQQKASKRIQELIAKHTEALNSEQVDGNIEQRDSDNQVDYMA